MNLKPGTVIADIEDGRLYTVLTDQNMSMFNDGHHVAVTDGANQDPDDSELTAIFREGEFEVISE